MKTRPEADTRRRVPSMGLRGSSERILDLLLRLNAERGLTIVLVTHDHDIARRAQRTITMRDGRLEY